ncbi:MAG: zinc-ribbon domain-containing protein, partial [Alphaproteobacteria bacterium]|nr:zinc-ribbon domain-containing protein [Alphaproteobacteria bacterium]
MLIKCPKCRLVYDLPDNLIGDDGLKMRCSKCLEIWTAYPEDGLKKVNVSPKNIQKMFTQLSKQTDVLFTEEIKKAPIQSVEKARTEHAKKQNFVANLIIGLLIFLSVSILLYAYRFDVVRFFPNAEQMYKKLNISSVPYATGLEFNNITTKEYVQNNVSKIEISGMVTNKSKYAVLLAPVKIDIFDKN